MAIDKLFIRNKGTGTHVCLCKTADGVGWYISAGLSSGLPKLVKELDGTDATQLELVKEDDLEP